MNKFRFVSIFLALVVLVGLVAVTGREAYAADYSTVRYGSTGEDVKTLQKMLNLVDNADLAVDGKFGKNTQTAVKNYQADKKLTVDGVVGSKTWAALSKDYAIKNSKLAIGSGKYAPGTLYVGDTYSINGKITSNYKITAVTVGIYEADGTATAQVKTAKPNAKSFDISKLDSGIKFGTLGAGSYKFKVVATDASGNRKTLVNKSFKVALKSTLAIGSGKYAPGTMTIGGTYSISGEITSNYEITSVTVGIYTKSGAATAQVKTINPNAKSFDISEADKSIKFGTLAVGTYYFKVTATDASGLTKTLVNNAFAVKGTAAQTVQANAMANWVAPVRTSYLAIPGTGRGFGAGRTSTRAHAGIDFYVRKGHGTPVYAMEGGTVIEYVANFYAGTSAVAIKHADGSILRYCEISTHLRVGDKVQRGQKIGKIIANTKDGGTMLHLELYAGSASGRLTNRTNKTYDFAPGTKYNRRRDLMNPEFLINIKRTK